MGLRPLVSVSLNQQDINNLADTLKDFSDKMGSKIIVNSMFSGGKIALEAAKIKVPVAEGELEKSLDIIRLRKSEGLGARVLARRSKATPGGYYAHLVELGHRQVRKLRNGRILDLGHTPAQPFMRPAVEENRDKIIEAIRAKAAAGIAKEIKKRG